MNRTIIYTRTDKGERAASAASSGLASDLRMILSAIDGSSSVDALHGRLDHLSASMLDEGLAALAADDLIRTATASMPDRRSGRATTNKDYQRRADDLRAKIKAKREGAERSPTASDVLNPQGPDQVQGNEEEQVRREAAEHAEAQARRMAEEQARRGVAEEEARLKAAAERARQEAEAQARLLADEQVRREAAERGRQEAEEQAKRAAAELARRDAEEKARREAEVQAQKLAEEQLRREAAERARLEAEAQAQLLARELAQRDAEAQARRAAEEEARREAERERHEAEERARVAADEQAWREAEEKYRREEQEAAEEARKRAAAKGAKLASTKPRNWVLPLALGLAGLVVVALVAVHLISYDGQIPQFEKAAAAQFQQPVKIKALRLSLLPKVQLRLEGVSIGAEGQIKVPQITATGDLGNLFSDKKVFKSVEMDSPVMTEAGLGWILFGKATARDVVFGQVTATNARLESKGLNLPAFEARLQSDGQGAWKAIVIESTDKNLNLELAAKGESVQIDFKARSFRIPFGSELTLDELVASGTADKAQLAVTEFKGFAYGGILSGNALLKWGGQWNLAGELNAKQMDMTRLVPGLMEGRLMGAGAYAMQSPEAAKLFAANRLEGNFIVARGTLMGIDIGRMVQGGAMSGETKFAELAGSFLHDRGATQLRQVRLTEGAISANGGAEVDVEGNVRGRFAVDLKMSAEQRRANLVVAGNLKKVEWRRP
ncbi:MAG: hypothetical protein Q8L44_09075 [Sulfuritalea sp.]|nr:hypothetical protein [Sulfuritalea sp.]